MGDIIEKTISYYDLLEFYKPGGKSMWVDIKANQSALIGLTQSVNDNHQIWIEFSNPGRIRINNETNLLPNLPFTLSNENYTRFWVAWDAKHLWVGIGQSPEIVVSAQMPWMINYVTFSTKDRRSPCTFLFEVPPLSMKASVQNTPKVQITTGKLEWRTCDNQLPDDAVIGGHLKGEAVYVIRGHVQGSLTPGMFLPSEGLAFIAWGGSDNATGDFEALCGYNFEWTSAFFKKIPSSAFLAGYSEDNHEPLFVGRARYQGHLIPGKVQMSHKVCYIPFEGKEIAVKDFDVLTEPSANPYVENEFIHPSINQRQYQNFHDGDEFNDHEEYEEQDEPHDMHAYMF